MNKARRARIREHQEAVESLKQEIEEILTEEESALGNLPDGLQESSRAEAAQAAIDALQEALDGLDEVLVSLNEAAA